MKPVTNCIPTGGEVVSRASKSMLSIILAAGFLLPFLPLYTAHAAPPRNVLILNSYQQDLVWTNQETEGIHHALDKSGLDLNVDIEYMDWKNDPTQANLDHLKAYYEYKYSRKKLDMVLATDDAALKFALENRSRMFSDAPVIYCGVNAEEVRRITAGYANVAGITEDVDPASTVRLALSLHPGLKKIYVVYDRSDSGISTGALTMHAIKKADPSISVVHLDGQKLDDIMDTAALAEADSCFLVTLYYTDPEHIVSGYENFIQRLREVSHVPIWALYDSGLNRGAIGGSMLSGRLQGEQAGAMAVRVLQGENMTTIPVSQADTSHTYFDYNELKRFGIQLGDLPAGSTVVNKPFSFLEAYRYQVIVVGLTIMMQMASIIALAYFLYKSLQTRKRLEKSDKRYAQLFEKMLNGFMILEPVHNSEGVFHDIKMISANPGVEKQTGLPMEELLRRTMGDVIRSGNSYVDGGLIHALEKSDSVKFEVYQPSIDQHFTANAFKVGDHQIGVVFENITDYIHAMDEIRKLNAELEERVSARTRELEEAVQELEAYAYTVSHDLKAPLRAIEDCIALINEEYGGSLNEGEAGGLLHLISVSCKDMIEMITKLLQYSITSKTVLSKELLDPEQLFMSVYQMIAPSNQDRKLIFRLETGLPKVWADPTLFRQVITNLLSNAIKYTRHVQDAQITVGCRYTGDEIIFYVQDNGVGFEKEFSDKLFGLFQRLHSVEEFEGHGIGLVTVKSIIHKHGGRTWITGESGQGATAYFTLPASALSE